MDTTARPCRSRLFDVMLVLALPLLVMACGAAGESTPEEEVGKNLESITGQIIWPISGSITQSSAPAPGHPGIDIGAVVGTPVFAAASGAVVAPFNDPGGYGCNVVINHTGGTSLASGIITV